MDYIFFSTDGISFPIAYKLLQEGQTVLVAQTRDVKELGNEEKETPEEKKKRLSLYDGVFDKQDPSVLLEKMKSFKKDDWFVVCDFNDLWKYGEACLKMGFKNGFFPTKADFELEKNRKKGKEIVKKHYNLGLGEVSEYKKAQDAINDIQQSNDTFVLKGDDDSAETVCPTDKNDELARRKVVRTLMKDPKNYESKGFILEKKIKDPVEHTAEAQFYNGQLIMMTDDIESKAKNAGDEGEQTGCSQNLIVKIDERSPLAQLAFPPYVWEQAKKHTGLFVIDASIFFPKKIFGEFCYNRWGFDSIQTQLAMCSSVHEYFESLVAGKNPLKYKFGVGIRGFNDDTKDGHYLEDEVMEWMSETDKDTWIFDMKMKGEDVVNTGYWQTDLVVFTGAGNTIDEALNKAHKARQNFSFPNMTARPKFDFMAPYATSIGSRYEWGKKQGFFGNSVLNLKK